MMNFKRYLYLILVIFSYHSFGQQIDTSLLSQLSPEQIEKVKDSLGTNALYPEAEDSSVSNESLVEKVPSEDMNKIDGKKFGYDFFSKMPTSLTAVGDLPLSNDYKISLRDQLRVILSGSKDAIFDLSVRLDGTILFPEIGSISIVGLTFKEVKEKLSQKISESYIGVNIDVALKDLSAKKITIVGAVNTPGTYLVNPFSTITSALAYSGGVSEIGSLRDIKLIRSSGDIYSFDLYELLIMGNRENDLNIQAGDTILITAADQFVEIQGAVNRPGIYELFRNETIEDAITFSLGFTQTANKSKISVSILDIESASIIKKTTDNLESNLENVLDISVFNYVSQEKSSIQVLGAVKEPGFYSLNDFKSLSDLINGLEFIDVYPWLAVLEQFDDKNLIKSSLLFSLKDKKTYQDIKLLPNSKVHFANIDSINFTVNNNSQYLINQFSLTLDHAQGDFVLPVIGRFSVLDLVNLVGLNMDNVENEVTYISPSQSLIIKESYETLELEAQRYNYLKFRSPINDLIKVNISGAIEFPGEYVLRSDSSLKDIYDLVGSFKEEAYLSGIILTRDTVRDLQIQSIERSKMMLEKTILATMQDTDTNQNLDLLMLSSSIDQIDQRYLGRISGDFRPGSYETENTLLMDGDEIIVPKTPSTINIFGEVLNPISVQFRDDVSVREAISIAGGTQKFADQGRIYVIRANGEVVRLGRNIFINNIDLEPGDTIIVPRKVISSSPFLKALAPITQILSDVAFSAAAIESLSNN